MHTYWPRGSRMRLADRPSHTFHALGPFPRQKFATALIA